MFLDIEVDANCKQIEFLGRSLRLKGIYHSEVLGQIQSQVLYNLLPEFLEQATPLFQDSKYFSEAQVAQLKHCAILETAVLEMGAVWPYLLKST